MRTIATALFAIAVAVTLWTACKTPTAPEASAVKEVAPLRADNCGTQGDANRANVHHCEGKFVIDGKYNLRPEAMKNYRIYGHANDRKVYSTLPAVAPNRFGTFLMRVPTALPNIGDGFENLFFRPLKSGSTGQTKYFRELHYHLGDSYDFTNHKIKPASQNHRVGMRIIPVVDRKGSPFKDDEYWPGDDNPFWDYDPSKDNLRVSLGQGTSIYGSEELDKFLRVRYGSEASNADFPIYSLIAYTHPEQHEAKLFDVLKPKFKFKDTQGENRETAFLKTENGITHLGMYIGEGNTRNAPYLYHEMKWENKGYPVNIYTVELEGVDPSILNYNMQTTVNILNEFGQGVVFPEDYKFDNFRTINLKEVLDFLRGWLDHNWVRPEDENKPIWSLAELRAMETENLEYYADVFGVYQEGMNRTQLITKINEKQQNAPFYVRLTEVDSYRTYCAEHATIVTNVGLNVIHSESGYVDIWGETEGKKLWRKARDAYKDIYCEGVESEECQLIPLSEEEKFETLWQKHGISDPTATTDFGKSLAWPVETTADLMADLIENYLNWTDEGVSPYYSAVAMVGMAPIVLHRLKISADDYLDLIVPPMAMTLKHSYTVEKHRILDAFPEGAIGRFKLKSHMNTKTLVQLKAVTALVGKMIKSQAGLDLDLQNKVVKPVMEILKRRENLDYIIANYHTSPTDAWKAFGKDVDQYIQKAREVQGGTGGEGKYVMYYSPPGIIHRIASNMHPHDPYVKVREVATVMDASEVCATNRAETVYDPLMELEDGYKCSDDPGQAE